MALIPEYPYDNYKAGYIVLNKKENRRSVCLMPTKGSVLKRTTVAYARYLYAVKEGRLLDRSEQVDHKDGDCSNDSIDNLQILSSTENNNKRLQQRQINRKWVRLKCPGCNNVFDRPVNKTFISKKGLYTCCSRLCLSKVNKQGCNDSERMADIGKHSVIKYFNIESGSMPSA